MNIDRCMFSFIVSSTVVVVAVKSTSCTSFTLIATHPEQTVHKQHSSNILNTFTYKQVPAYGTARLFMLMTKMTPTSNSQKSIIRVIKWMLYCTENFPVKLSGSVCTRATASCTLLMPNRYQKSSNGNGTFITPLKYLSFMEGNKDKWKSLLSRRYNGLIKADGHWNKEFLKILMPHKGNNVQD